MVSYNEIIYSSLVAGGVAGLVVDVLLFPLDTFKTRLQSSEGFLKSGGFRNIYKGLAPQVIGSAPMGNFWFADYYMIAPLRINITILITISKLIAAVFFCTYETFNHVSEPLVSPMNLPFIHMMGATTAEITTCLIKVPVEVIKQRQQTSNRSPYDIIQKTYQLEGFIDGFYRGFRSTILREVPFALLQFPIFEYFKTCYKRFLTKGESLSSWQVALCGALAGGISAAITTPLDVAKTRIMLANKSVVSVEDLNVSKMLQIIYKSSGFRGLFAGFVPRVIWITIGGAIFFGTYDLSKLLFVQCYERRRP